jgi:hypothetical protein
VVTRTTGLAPDVERAGAGRVVDAGPHAIARAVAELLDPAANDAASQAAFALVQERFTIEKVVGTLRGVYAEVSSRALSPICQR